MAFLSPRCPGLKSPLLREPQDHGLLELCRLQAAPLQRIASFTGKAALPCLVFLLTPQFSDGVRLQLTPSPIQACLPENKMYFHQQVIHLCLELVCLSLRCRFLPSSIFTPQLSDSLPKPLINGGNLNRKGRRNKSLHIFSQ